VALAILLLVAGTIVLGLGATALTRGAARVLLARGAPPRAVGLVFLGLNLGPLIATILASSTNRGSFAGGLPLGAAAYLMAAGLGTGLLLRSNPVRVPSLMTILLPAVPLAAAGVAVGDAYVTRVEGVGLLAMFAIYLFIMSIEEGVLDGRADAVRRDSVRGIRLPAAVLAAGGLAVALGGGEALLRGGTSILDHTGLSAGFVGAAFLGPLSALGGLRSVLPPQGDDHERDTVDHSAGSLVSLATGAVGLAAVIRPIAMDGTAAFAAVAASAVYVPIATILVTRGRAGRVAGLATVALAAVWVLVALRF
jgi:cation:H+ antiporter